MAAFWAKAKWFVLAFLSGVGLLLAVLYGKKTPQVLRMQLAEVEARSKALNLELQAAVDAAAQKQGSAEAAKYQTKADDLSKKLVSIQAARDKVLNESKDLPTLSDDAVAAADNARARSPTGSGT